MKTITFKRTIITALIIISVIFVFQIISNTFGYISAANYIENGNYSEASVKLEKLDGFRDSETLKEYCDIMAEYDSTDFTSVYHSYRGLQNISNRFENPRLSNEFLKAMTEIETMYNNYNVLLYAN